MLISILARRIRDRRFMRLIENLLTASRHLYRDPRVRRFASMTPEWPLEGRGIPIGTYTSQLFASHIYLNEFDHFVKRALRVPGYLRYVDDIFLFGTGRAELREWRERVKDWLLEKRHLRLKSPNARIRSCLGHLDGLGKRITRAGIAPRAGSIRDLRSRLRRQIHGEDKVDLERSLASVVGNLLSET